METSSQHILKLITPPILLTAVILGVVAGASHIIPLTYEEPLVTGTTASKEFLTPEESREQTFRTNGDPIAGLTVATSPGDVTKKPTAHVTNSDGTFSTKSWRTSTQSKGNQTRITFQFIPFDTTETEDFTLSIANNSQEDISLRVFPDNPYPHGKDTVDVELSAKYKLPSTSARTRGIIAGGIIMLGAGIIQSIKRYRFLSAALLIIIVTPIALSGFWAAPTNLGISDWDLYFSVHHSLRASVIEFRQFPLWNPYTCGGTAALADPEFNMLTPTFLLFELPFGIPIGMRLSIYFTVIVGSLGMLFLGRQLKYSASASLLSAIAVFFSSAVILRHVEGHISYFAVMYIPWILSTWLYAYRYMRKRKKITLTQRLTHPGVIVAGLLLALMFSQAGIHVLLYTITALLALPLLTRRPRQAFLITTLAGLWAVGLAAIKLIPALLWLSQFKDAAYASSTFTLPHLHYILLGRYLHGSENIPNQGGGWHEYGAYIGIIVLGLAVVGIWSKRRTLSRGLLIATGLAILASTSGPYLKPLFDQIPFIPRSNVSRYILLAVFALALLSGLGLDGIGRKIKYAFLTPLIIGLAAMEIMSLASLLSEQPFIIPSKLVDEIAEPPISFSENTHPIRINGIDYTRSYLTAKAGYGTLNYCTVLSPAASISASTSPEDSSFLHVSPNDQDTELITWTPNSTNIRASLTTEATIKLNTNYATGWQIKTEEGQNRPASNTGGRVSTTLPPGEHSVTFHYRAPGFRTGVIVTLITLLVGIYHLLSFRRGKNSHKK